jgi:hypothetical protein
MMAAVSALLDLLDNDRVIAGHNCPPKVQKPGFGLRSFRRVA